MMKQLLTLTLITAVACGSPQQEQAANASDSASLAASRAHGCTNVIQNDGPNSGSWHQLGANLLGQAGASAAFAPSLASDSAGHLAVAWSEEDSAGYSVYVAQWNGSSWVLLGGPLNGTGTPSTIEYQLYPKLTLDSAGNPIVTFVEFIGPSTTTTGDNFGTYAYRWNGSAFLPITAAGNPSFGSGAGDAMVVSRQGHTFIGFAAVQNSGWADDYQIAEVDGFAAHELGGFLGGGLATGLGQGTETFALDVDASGQPFISWVDAGVNMPVVARWTGGSWDQVGPPVPYAGFETASVEFSLNGEQPVVAYNTSDNHVNVASLGASDWQIAPPLGTVAYEDALRIDPTAAPVVAWTEVGTSPQGGPPAQVIVARLQNNVWATSTVPGATDWETKPDLTFDNTCAPIVATTVTDANGAVQVVVSRYAH
jgi:hypothetical protein